MTVAGGAELPASWPVAAPRRRATWAKPAAALAVYCALGLLVMWPVWPGDPSRLIQGPAGDASLETWMLAYTAHAVAHGQNLFFTRLINAPVGANLTVSTQMPLLGLLLAPLTFLAGPVSSFSLGQWLAFVTSAAAMGFVLRRLEAARWPSFAGGLLYGFSPYLVGQAGAAHLNLAFVPLPPLVVWLVLEVTVRRRQRLGWWGAALGGAVGLQLWISPEVCATTLVLVGLGAAAAAVARPSLVAPTLARAWPAMVGGVGVAAALAAYPLAGYLWGPLGVAHATEHGVAQPLGAAAAVVPTHLQWLTPGGARAGDHLLSFLPPSEDGDYLGLPLVALLAYLVVRGRRDAWLRLAAFEVVAAWALSLGPRLRLGGHTTSIPLPAATFAHVPLLRMVVPSRLGLYMVLFAAVVLGRGLTLRLEAPSRPHRRRRGLEAVGLAAAQLLAAVFLLPAAPAPWAPTATPTFFTSGAVDRLAGDRPVLTYPYALPLYAQPMLWQATASLPFPLIGGYLLTPSRDGLTFFPASLPPLEVQRFFVLEQGGEPFYPLWPPPSAPATVTALRSFAARYGLGGVVVNDATRHAEVVRHVVTSALGGGHTSGGVTYWRLGRRGSKGGLSQRKER